VATDAHAAKRPLTALAGPYGHPFHPALVTVPIGAWVASLVFDLVSREADDPEIFATGSAWLIGVGLAGAVVAAGFGLLDLLAIPPGTPAFRTGLLHMGLNLTAVALYGASLAVRVGSVDEGNVTVPGFVLAVAALALVGASGWRGGKLAYSYGVRVADEATQARGFGPRDAEEAGRRAGLPDLH
jgi:uncharacterized membrane protein